MAALFLRHGSTAKAVLLFCFEEGFEPSIRSTGFPFRKKAPAFAGAFLIVYQLRSSFLPNSRPSWTLSVTTASPATNT